MSCVIESDEELEMEMLKVSASGFIFQFFSNDAALGSQWSGAQLRGGNMKQNYLQKMDRINTGIPEEFHLLVIICLVCHLYYTSLDLIHPLD